MYVVYLKKFEDGSVYIGSTKDFKSRMRQHIKDAFNTKRTDYPIRKKIREVDFEDKILIKNIKDLSLALFLEENITLNYRRRGYNVLNILDGRKRNDGKNSNPVFNKKGEESKKANTIEYYAHNPVLRSSFKRTCKRMGWDFNSFDEVFGEWYIRPNDKTRRKKNLYIKKY